MTLDEYIKLAKEELDAMAEEWKENNRLEPDYWPMEMSEGEWGATGDVFPFLIKQNCRSERGRGWDGVK